MSTEPRPTNLLTKIDGFRVATKVPSVLAGRVDQDGALEIEAVGQRRRNDPTDQVTVADSVHIGSCGKAMTSALYGRLVEAGLAEWDVPIRALFDDMSDVDAGWLTPTIDDLLHCRAGVIANPPLSEMKALFADTATLPDQRSAATQGVLAEPPKTPGKFVYSNLGYIVAGAAIERLAAMPFEDALRTYLTEPLAMTSLGYGPPPQISSHRPRVQLGPLVIGRGKSVDVNDPHGDNPPLFTPAGRYHLTIEDWSRFLVVFLREGDGFLRPDTILRLIETPPGKPPSMAMGWVSAKPYGSIAQQGSNTMWSATAMLDTHMKRAAIVVANDGRTTVLRKSAMLAKDLLA